MRPDFPPLSASAVAEKLESMDEIEQRMDGEVGRIQDGYDLTRYEAIAFAQLISIEAMTADVRRIRSQVEYIAEMLNYLTQEDDDEGDASGVTA